MRQVFEVAKDWVRSLLPDHLRRSVGLRIRGLSRRPPVGFVRFGSLRRLSPISGSWGVDRGIPIDRYYIERFLSQWAVDVRGSVLEIRDNWYARRFGGDRVKELDILSLLPGNPLATIIADLEDAKNIRDCMYDCIIITQTLQLIYNYESAIRTMHRVLRPGGVALVTVPGISKIARDDVEDWSAQWHFTQQSAKTAFSKIFGDKNVAASAHGNVLAATAFLHGLAICELRESELRHEDRDFPLIIAVRAQKQIMSSDQSGREQLVSVIVPFFNAERFIDDAIASVFSQTYRNWELLLINDGSTDSSPAIARRCAEAHPSSVTYLEHPGRENRGNSASRNVGIARAKGSYLAFLDADDVWMPNKLEQQVMALMAAPEAAMIYGAAWEWHSWTGKTEDLTRDKLLPVVPPGDGLYQSVDLSLISVRDVRLTPSLSGVLARREAVEAVGYFDDSFFRNLCVDQNLYFKLGLRSLILASNDCWYKYRQHPDSVCAVASRTGGHSLVKRQFLSWALHYLTSSNYSRTDLYKAVVQELSATQPQEGFAAFFKSGIKRITPYPVRRWVRKVISKTRGTLFHPTEL